MIFIKKYKLLIILTLLILSNIGCRKQYVSLETNMTAEIKMIKKEEVQSKEPNPVDKFLNSKKIFSKRADLILFCSAIQEENEKAFAFFKKSTKKDLNNELKEELKNKCRQIIKIENYFKKNRNQCIKILLNTIQDKKLDELKKINIEDNFSTNIFVETCFNDISEDELKELYKKDKYLKVKNSSSYLDWNKINPSISSIEKK